METDITYYKARWVYPVTSPPIENGVIAVSQGKIVFVGEARAVNHQSSIINHQCDLGDGVIFPALINAHTHLDLSALKGRLNAGLGFLPWVRSLLGLRDSLTEDERLSAIQEAVKDLHHYGTIAVGDWTGSLKMDGFKHLHDLVRCVFYEVIGFSDQTLTFPVSLTSELRTPNSPGFPAQSSIINHQSSICWFSLGAHAPHTTSPALLTAAKAWTANRGLPLSIHVAESTEEEEFLFTGQGPWREFLMERGKWPGQWEAPGSTSVSYLDGLGVLNEKTVCVHLTRAGSDDLRLLKKKQVSVVVCPRSNHFISGALPRLSEMLHIGLSPALGTDSLASNHDLNLWEEMAFIHHSFPEMASETILQMGTINGAKALDLENERGSISPGKKAGMLFIPLAGCSAKELSEAIIDSRGKDHLWIGDGRM